MKSTKTIFAISSIRCIKPLNSSSSCSPEQVYFSKKKKKNQKKQKTKTKQKIFIKCYDAKRKKKEKREKKVRKKEKKKKTSIFWVCTKTMKTYPSA